MLWGLCCHSAGYVLSVCWGRLTCSSTWIPVCNGTDMIALSSHRVLGEGRCAGSRGSPPRAEALPSPRALLATAPQPWEGRRWGQTDGLHVAHLPSTHIFSSLFWILTQGYVSVDFRARLRLLLPRRSPIDSSEESRKVDCGITKMIVSDTSRNKWHLLLSLLN